MSQRCLPSMRARFAVCTEMRVLENMRKVTRIVQFSNGPCVIIRKSSYPAIRATRSNQARPGNRRMIRKGKKKMRTLSSFQYFLLALLILAVPATSRAQFSAQAGSRAEGRTCAKGRSSASQRRET
jgi:hypothetical protein